jgi:AcrR family transcriptional regulator
MKPAHFRRKSEEKRAYLIERATRCLAQKGYARVSLRDIARESGVSLGILHYYFASKEDLLAAVIDSYKSRFVAELERELLNGPVEGWLGRLASVLGRTLEQDRAIHRLWYDFQVQAMYEPVFRTQVNEVRTRMLTLIERMVGRLQQSGVGLSSPYTPETVGPILYSLVDGLFFQALLNEGEEQPSFEWALTTLLAPFFERDR